jgi:Ribbon-helix-helix domain
MPKSKGRKVKTSIYLDQARLTALKAISDRTMIPMSSLIRKGIDNVLAEYGQAPKK